MKKNVLCALFISLIAGACHTKDAQETAEPEPEITTPVTITSASTGIITEYIDLNATSSYLLKAIVKASANGFIQSANVQPGKMVSARQNVFTLKTKEAQSIGNTVNSLDTSFKFSGIISISAGTTGYVSEVNHQPGDYVQEGEQLAVINDANSFVFILNLPYELRPYVLDKKTVDLLLPDGKKMTGIIASAMPVVDSISQTQNIIIKVPEKNLPINLIAKVRVLKTAKTNAVSLPKQSVLSDETQTSFWVMKVIDSTTAIKVPVTKGIEINDRVEILSPAFSPPDKFLLTGNYGLGDTAKIKIIRE
jgi:multidrug efflux pump subunit AcrA (membrane-fusion protein)